MAKIPASSTPPRSAADGPSGAGNLPAVAGGSQRLSADIMLDTLRPPERLSSHGSRSSSHVSTRSGRTRRSGVSFRAAAFQAHDYVEQEIARTRHAHVGGTPSTRTSADSAQRSSQPRISENPPRVEVSAPGEPAVDLEAQTPAVAARGLSARAAGWARDRVRQSDLFRLWSPAGDRAFFADFRGSDAARQDDVEASAQADATPVASLVAEAGEQIEAVQASGLPREVAGALTQRLRGSQTLARHLQQDASLLKRVATNGALIASNALPLAISKLTGQKKWFMEVNNSTSRFAATALGAALSPTGTNAAITWDIVRNAGLLAQVEAAPYALPAFVPKLDYLKSFVPFNVGVTTATSIAALAVFYPHLFVNGADWLASRLPGNARETLHDAADKALRQVGGRWPGLGRTAAQRAWNRLTPEQQAQHRPMLRSLYETSLRNAEAVAMVTTAFQAPHKLDEELEQFRVKHLTGTVVDVFVGMAENARARSRPAGQGLTPFTGTQLEQLGDSFMQVAHATAPLLGLSEAETQAMLANPRKAAKAALAGIFLAMAGTVSLMNVPSLPSVFGNAFEGVSTFGVLMRAALKSTVDLRRMVELFCMMCGGTAISTVVLGADWAVDFARSNGLQGRGFIENEHNDIGLGVACLFSTFVNLGFTGALADVAAEKLEPKAERFGQWWNDNAERVNRAVTRSALRVIESAMRPA